MTVLMDCRGKEERVSEKVTGNAETNENVMEETFRMSE